VFGFIKMLLRELPGLSMNIANAITMASYNGTYTGSSVIQTSFQKIVLPHAVIWAASPEQRSTVSDRFAYDTEKQANHKSKRLANARDVEIIKNEKGIRRKLQYSYMQRITLAELNLIMPTLGKTKSDALLKLQINIYAKGFDSQIPASKDPFTSSSDAAKGTTADLYDRLKTILCHETTPVLLDAPLIAPHSKKDALETYGEQTEQGKLHFEQAQMELVSLWKKLSGYHRDYQHNLLLSWDNVIPVVWPNDLCETLLLFHRGYCFSHPSCTEPFYSLGLEWDKPCDTYVVLYCLYSERHVVKRRADQLIQVASMEPVAEQLDQRDWLKECVAAIPPVAAVVWSLEKPAARPDKDVGVRVKLVSGYDQDDYLWDCVKTHGIIVRMAGRKFVVHWFAEGESDQTHTSMELYAAYTTECPNFLLESLFPVTAL